MGGFSKAELLAILSAARSKRERDWLMFLVAYTHALRASELLKLKADNIENGHTNSSLGPYVKHQLFWWAGIKC